MTVNGTEPAFRSGGLHANGDTIERSLGRISNELEHQTKEVAEHAATLKELLADRRSTKQRLEILERDASQSPKGAGKMIEILSKGLTELAARVESVEHRQQREAHTEPPRRADRRDDEGSTRPSKRDPASRGESAGTSKKRVLDSFF